MWLLSARGTKHRVNELIFASDINYRQRRARVAVAAAALLACWLLAYSFTCSHWASGGSDRLVIYIHADTDAEYRGNLEFFLQHAVQNDNGKVDYVFVIQVGDAAAGAAHASARAPTAATQQLGQQQRRLAHQSA
jgi:hypothetical protein